MEDTWICPRCRESINVTENGIVHASNVNGPHFQRYSLEELLAIKKSEEKEFNKIYYGRED